MQLSLRQQDIINIVTAQPHASISQIKKSLREEVSMPTMNRDMATLVAVNYLLKSGKGRATAYSISPHYKIFAPLVTESYFDKDPDARQATATFNHDLLSILETVDVLMPEEVKRLLALKQEYQDNIADFPPALYQKELERLTIELSWKSSQIEGNTYSLLETERLFLEKEEAKVNIVNY